MITYPYLPFTFKTTACFCYYPFVNVSATILDGEERIIEFLRFYFITIYMYDVVRYIYDNNSKFFSIFLSDLSQPNCSAKKREDPGADSLS